MSNRQKLVEMAMYFAEGNHCQARECAKQIIDVDFSSEGIEDERIHYTIQRVLSITAHFDN